MEVMCLRICEQGAGVCETHDLVSAAAAASWIHGVTV